LKITEKKVVIFLFLGISYFIFYYFPYKAHFRPQISPNAMRPSKYFILVGLGLKEKGLKFISTVKIVDLTLNLGGLMSQMNTYLTFNCNEPFLLLMNSEVGPFLDIFLLFVASSARASKAKGSW
jgi:hypothetical protein